MNSTSGRFVWKKGERPTTGGESAGVALPRSLGEGHVGAVSPGEEEEEEDLPPRQLRSMYREKDPSDRRRVMPADPRDLESKGRPLPVIPSVTVTSDSFFHQSMSGDQDGSSEPPDFQDQLDDDDEYQDQPEFQDQSDSITDYKDHSEEYQDQSERPDGLTEQLSEKLSALLIKQLSGGQESGVECECGALEEWSSEEGSASMAEDEVLFDEVYDVHEVIGK